MSRKSSLDFTVAVDNYCLHINGFNSMFFRNILKNLFHYQWTRTFLELNKEAALCRRIADHNCQTAIAAGEISIRLCS
jgi:hypothetical protein